MQTLQGGQEASPRRREPTARKHPTPLPGGVILLVPTAFEVPSLAGNARVVNRPPPPPLPASAAQGLPTPVLTPAWRKLYIYGHESRLLNSGRPGPHRKHLPSSAMQG